MSELTAPRALRDSNAIARLHSLNRLQQANQDSKQLVSMIFFSPLLTKFRSFSSFGLNWTDFSVCKKLPFSELFS